LEGSLGSGLYYSHKITTGTHTGFKVYENANSALTGRILVSFASLNHFLKFNIEKPTTSPLSGLTLRKKSLVKILMKNYMPLSMEVWI